MSRLYACILTDDVKQHRETLLAIAGRFAHSIEAIEDGVLFDVRGLQRLIGTPKQIEKKIESELRRYKLSARLAVADTIETAMLLARRARENANFEELPLADLDIEQDTLNIFTDLGLRNVKDLLAIPHEDLIGRYGRSFQNVIDVAEQKGTSLLTPNIKESKVSWSFDLDKAVENFEQLIFVANHGLERLFQQVERAGFSCEHLDLEFKLKNRTAKAYVVKISFPTLERSFWLKLINLRIALDPLDADIVSIKIVTHFSKALSEQRGLYAVSRPEPESLLLTAGKLRKLVGEANVGIPCLLDLRAIEPFKIDTENLPDVSVKAHMPETEKRVSSVMAFTYYRPPMRAEIMTENCRMTFIRTRQFSGAIKQYSGVWKAASRWWDKPWSSHEWDIEVDGHGIYRLRRVEDEYFLIGEYD